MTAAFCHERKQDESTDSPVAANGIGRLRIGASTPKPAAWQGQNEDGNKNRGKSLGGGRAASPAICLPSRGLPSRQASAATSNRMDPAEVCGVARHSGRALAWTGRLARHLAICAY
jgi:hypothetical protein